MKTKKQLEQEAEERFRAREGEQKKGFFRDLGWELIIYNLFFGGIGYIIIFYPSILYPDGKANPYSSILPFFLAFLIDVVSIWHYVRYSPSKPPRHIPPPDEIPGL